MRMLFGIMSAVQPVGTVAALCDAIGTDHSILIHHDFGQQADFVLERRNVSFVENPVRTGWASWGFSQGILKLVHTAMERSDWDFFQLLSPTCMPIRRLDELEAHLTSTAADYYVDGADIATESRMLMSHGWRAYAQQGLWRHRVLRTARRWYFEPDAQMANHRGLSFPIASHAGGSGIKAVRARIALGITLAAKRGFAFRHVFSDGFRCYAGSTWFGASRRGCAYLIEKTAEGPFLRHFKGMHMADEMLYPSVFKNSSLRGAPSLHHVSRFVDARPAWITVADLDEVMASGRFFARKFPEDAGSEVRAELGRRLPAQTGLTFPEPRKTGTRAQ